MPISIVTHDGDFHPDDVFAVATLQLYLGDDTQMTVTRTRDTETISNADWVLDVGEVYDPEAKHFDHHQPGAPVRDNGVPYAAFGLIWQHLGLTLCENDNEIAEAIDHTLVQPIDAGDNGVSLYELNERQLSPFELYQVIESFHEAIDPHTTIDEMFLEAVTFAKNLLRRLIHKEKRKATLRAEAQTIYQEQQPANGIIVAEHPISVNAFAQFPYIHVVVKPKTAEADSHWVAKVLAQDGQQFANRALFPELWAGLRDDELAEASGIPDAIFCHNARFIFVAKSRAGAIAAAQQAVPVNGCEKVDTQ